MGMLDAHTEPATRRIANATIWLFAIAMALPLSPGFAYRSLQKLVGHTRHHGVDRRIRSGRSDGQRIDPRVYACAALQRP